MLDLVRTRWGFDLEAMLLAVDGWAASAWVAEKIACGMPFDRLEWIFKTEERIERFASEGRKVWAAIEARERAERLKAVVVVQSVQEPQQPTEEEAAHVQAARERMAKVKAFIQSRQVVR